MQRYLTYLHQKLDEIYPSSEIGSFSRLLLGKLGGMSSAQIYSDKDRIFPEHTLHRLFEAIDRLAQNEPIQYILGETEFYGHTFKIQPGALIPRPETEELVEQIVQNIGATSVQQKLLDIGTGSGCIAISLAKAIPNASITAWDISTEALDLAKANANALKANVRFEQVDVLHYQPKQSEMPSFDLIVSNPPYVRISEATTMDANVLDYEPHVALFVDNDDALVFYRVISALAIELLKPGGSLYFEINSALGVETMQVVQSFPFRQVRLLQDLSGKDRMIHAIR